METPSTEMYETIKLIYDNISDELGLGVPYDLRTLEQHNGGEYDVRQALIESVAGGSDYFTAQGKISVVTIPPQPGNPLPQMVRQNDLTFSGWKHE